MFSDSLNPNNFQNYADDSAMIQAAADKAAETGCAVVIPRMNQRTGLPVWTISETIELYSGSTVYLDNCHLRLADGVFCNFFKNSNARSEKALEITGRQYDICICGFGNAVLDGGNHNGFTESSIGFPEIVKNTFIHFHNAERVTVEKLRVINHRWWGLTFHYCSDGHVSDIIFECNRNLMNMDGVDLRTGCHDFLIENLSGSTGDDMVALTNIPICSLYDVKGMDNSIHSVQIKNISARLTGNHAIVRLLNQGGRQLYNIQIQGVMDRSQNGEEYHRPYAAVRIGDMFYNYDKPTAVLGDTRGIIIRDVTTRAQNGIYIACTLQDALIDGVQMYDDAGTGVCFNHAATKNITISNLQYGANSSIPESDRGKIIQTTKDTMDTLAGIYFHKSKCEDLRINSMTMGFGADSVFAGNGSTAHIKLKGLTKQKSDMPIVKGEGIYIES